MKSLLPILITFTSTTSAFTVTNNININNINKPTCLAAKSDNSEDVVLFSDNPSDGSDTKFAENKRWNSLNPSVKSRIIKEGQQRAIQNKQKREPAATKKRRMMMHYKKAMVKSKNQSRITRPLPINSDDRTPLADISAGTTTNGTIISLTNFGAYVDIGTECDGLLHVSQISREVFVEHPRQMFTPGDQVEQIRVLRISPELKKVQLTMLPTSYDQDSHSNDEHNDDADNDEEERIDFNELAVDDELWGEIKRVTHYGAYVELGAVVQGWLHFMDHPEFVYGVKPNDIMSVGNRIRCWVANVDTDQRRIKLTANRPKDLPGPRRETTQKVSDDEYY